MNTARAANDVALGNALAHMHAGAASVLVPRFDADEAVRLYEKAAKLAERYAEYSAGK